MTNSILYLQFENSLLHGLLELEKFGYGEGHVNRPQLHDLDLVVHTYLCAISVKEITDQNAAHYAAKIMNAISIIYGSYLGEITYYRQSAGVLVRSKSSPSDPIYSLIDHLWDQLVRKYYDIFTEPDPEFVDLDQQIRQKRGTLFINER